MKVIGICGSTGSGKSSLCELLSRRGYPVLDCDKIYHGLVNSPSPCLSEIGETFGSDLISEGKLDRKNLGKIVFASPEKLALLNRISHKYVVLEIQKEIEILKDKGATHCFIDAPLLFEAGLEKICDHVCAVISDKEEQIKRVCRRDQITREEAIKRIFNQTPEEALRNKCDFIIENTGSLDQFQKACENFFEKIELVKGK